MKAPAAGMVNVLPNYRSSSGMFGGEQEFRQGDRAWPGAAILELPDLSSVHLEARFDESDRGRLTRAGRRRADRSGPGSRLQGAHREDFASRAADFASGWPPPKNFDLGLILLEVDPKIRPGMSAVARIATERVPDVTLLPSDAIFQRDGAAVVYKLSGAKFEERRVEIAKRGQRTGDRHRRVARAIASPPNARRPN